MPIKASGEEAEWTLKQVQGDDVVYSKGTMWLIIYDILRYVLSYWRKTKISSQIKPMRIIAFNQINFPLPMPIFQLFLAQNGLFHSVKNLKPNKAMHRIFFGKAVRYFATMLMQTAHQIRRHSNINRAVMTAGQYIYAGLFFHKVEHAVKWMLKQVQHDEIKIAAPLKAVRNDS